MKVKELIQQLIDINDDDAEVIVTSDMDSEWFMVASSIEKRLCFGRSDEWLEAVPPDTVSAAEDIEHGRMAVWIW